MSNKREKLRNQLKSSTYYLFWGACTIAVVTGQIYVGAGYDKMSESVRDLTKMVEIKLELDLRDRQSTIIF